MLHRLPPDVLRRLAALLAARGAEGREVTRHGLLPHAVRRDIAALRAVSRAVRTALQGTRVVQEAFLPAAVAAAGEASPGTLSMVLDAARATPALTALSIDLRPVLRAVFERVAAWDCAAGLQRAVARQGRAADLLAGFPWQRLSDCSRAALLHAVVEHTMVDFLQAMIAADRRTIPSSILETAARAGSGDVVHLLVFAQRSRGASLPRAQCRAAASTATSLGHGDVARLLERLSL